jgi:hypothetical protein
MSKIKSEWIKKNKDEKSGDHELLTNEFLKSYYANNPSDPLLKALFNALNQDKNKSANKAIKN